MSGGEMGDDGEEQSQLRATYTFSGKWALICSKYFTQKHAVCYHENDRERNPTDQLQFKCNCRIIFLLSLFRVKTLVFVLRLHSLISQSRGVYLNVLNFQKGWFSFFLGHSFSFRTLTNLSSLALLEISNKVTQQNSDVYSLFSIADSLYSYLLAAAWTLHN